MGKRKGVMRVEVREAASGELPWVNLKYREVDFLPSSPSDLIAVAEVMGARAGLGRLVPIEPCAEELGGIYVFPEFRSLGVSRAIVDFLVRRSRCEDLYCLPFCNLEDLYASFDFSSVRERAGVPPQIKRKHEWCNQHYSTPVLLMRRRRSDHAPASVTRSNTAVASSPGFSRG
jgi:GNAT superfamily N-acetyltransferase